MNVYCIGDIQGCYAELARLLEACRFDPAQDQIIALGDLINRGPESLKTLQFLRSLGASFRTVLGNHDLSILARIYSGEAIQLNPTARQIIDAPDAEELLLWLRHQALAIQHTHEDENILMIHAGLPPQWTIEQALQYAGEVESVLRGDDYLRYFSEMYGDEPALWSDELQGMPRLRFITNCLTRLRYCDINGHLALEHKSESGEILHAAGREWMPWFAVPQRASREQLILFGHWSRLQRCYWPAHRVWGLDTGCVWGGRLSALHLHSRRLIQAPALA